MLGVQSVDVGRIYMTSSLAGASGNAQPVERKEEPLLSFNSEKGGVSSTGMSRLEEDFLAAQASIQGANETGACNQQYEKSFSIMELQSEKDSNMSKINQLGQYLKTIFSDVLGVENSQSGVEIGKKNTTTENIDGNNAPISLGTNLFEKQQESLIKPNATAEKSLELTSLIEKTRALDNQIVANSTCKI